MRDYLATPFPGNNDLLKDIPVVSLDFETTGLDIELDKVVSIGLVNIRNLSIDLSTASHLLVNPGQDVSKSSVVIHQLTDKYLEKADAIQEVMPRILERLSGKVLLAHHAAIEAGFLNEICKHLYQTDFLIPVIDTQALAKRSFELQNKVYKNSELRLFNLRRELNLPAYKAHNALMDAIATAELLLAMIPRISPVKTAKLKDFLV